MTKKSTIKSVARGLAALTGNDPDAPSWTVFQEEAAKIIETGEGERP